MVIVHSKFSNEQIFETKLPVNVPFASILGKEKLEKKLT